jgi:1,4-dihydroxy-2-naphthoate octaprenyltransferase
MSRSDVAAVEADQRQSKLLGYFLLGKARIYQHSYALVLTFLLLHADGMWNLRLLPVLILTFVALQAFQYVAGAADDLGGYRDGCDAINYAGRPAITVAKKPLLTGAIDEREAVWFIAVCAAVGAASLAAAMFIGGIPSPAAVLVVVALAVAVPQYSLGLKLSYWPLGLETAVLLSTALLVLMPYWFTAGRLTPAAALTSALFGMWFLMVVCYGNASDIVGDKHVSRRTLAVLLPMPAYKLFLCGLYFGSVALLVSLFSAAHFVRFETLWVMAPLIALHSAQLFYAVVHDQWRRARFLGILSLDLGALGLTAAALLS